MKQILELKLTQALSNLEKLIFMFEGAHAVWWSVSEKLRGVSGHMNLLDTDSVHLVCSWLVRLCLRDAFLCQPVQGLPKSCNTAGTESSLRHFEEELGISHSKRFLKHTVLPKSNVTHQKGTKTWNVFILECQLFPSAFCWMGWIRFTVGG